MIVLLRNSYENLKEVQRTSWCKGYHPYPNCHAKHLAIFLKTHPSTNQNIKRHCPQGQAWWGRKRPAHGHHSPSSIQGKWLAIDDQKNNILASLCLASYVAANWLQKLKRKHCAYYAEVISVLMCVLVCLCGISVWFIYNKIKLPFCKMSVFVPYT